MTLLDSGGAAIHRRDERPDFVKGVERMLNRPRGVIVPPEPTVRFKIVETHDGVPCTCISSETSHLTLKVGEAVILTHTCHDGRVDKITATIEAVEGLSRMPEHGTAGKA